MEKRALGKGLSALIPEKTMSQNSPGREQVLDIPVSQIKTNKYQPRTEFNQERLNELMNSIKGKGVVQPVLVRTVPGGYELIAGERRLRAVKGLGMENIPVIIRNVADADMLEISLIENIQREELNPIEEARAFQRFITDFNFTQDKIAEVLSKDRSTISNTIRLLNLPKKIQGLISQGLISAGHARSLLSLPTEGEQIRIANLILKDGLSVRETEALVSRKKTFVRKMKPAKDQAIVDLENQLQHSLGTRVRIHNGEKGGFLQIQYYSIGDLNRILDIIISGKEKAA